jgi:hypothetical protein
MGECFGIFPDLDTSAEYHHSHSLGGATAANAMITEPRIVGGLNMDGSLFAPVTTKGLSQPFLTFSEGTHTHFTDASWNETWPLFRGWHEELSLKGAKHGSFGDLGFLVHTLGLGQTGNESTVVGSIDGGRAIEVERVVISDFFDFVLGGKKIKLLDCDNTGYPEVTCVTTCTPGISCDDTL